MRHAAATLESPAARAIVAGAVAAWAASMRPVMNDEEERAARAELARLLQEHRDLDAAIEALERLPAGDRLQVQRLKKRKLWLKDRIAFLTDQLTPDIIA